MPSSSLTLAVAVSMLAVGAFAKDAEKGEKVFKKCASCHQVGAGAKNRVGPVLTGVIGRSAGSYDGYKYGSSMKAAGEAGLIWDEDKLFDYLADPTAFLRAELGDPMAKAKMKFRLKKEEERRDVIAFLAGFGPVQESSAQSAAPLDGGAATAANVICVRNGNTHEYLFAVEAEGAERRVQMLKPGEILCAESSKADGHGVVTVYEHADEFEGCSRLVPIGQTEDMLKYVDFDRCFWSSNT